MCGIFISVEVTLFGIAKKNCLILQHNTTIDPPENARALAPWKY